MLATFFTLSASGIVNFIKIATFVNFDNIFLAEGEHQVTD